MVVIEEFNPEAIAIAYHDIIIPAVVCRGDFRSHGDQVASCLVIGRGFDLSVYQKMFPTDFVMLGRPGFIALDAGHTKVGWQR